VLFDFLIPLIVIKRLGLRVREPVGSGDTLRRQTESDASPAIADDDLMLNKKPRVVGISQSSCSA
jgi:hypothetical protein